MYCDSIEESFKQISAYFKDKSTGYALIIDTENIKVYSEIIQRLEADKSKNCSYVSDIHSSIFGRPFFRQLSET